MSSRSFTGRSWLGAIGVFLLLLLLLPWPLKTADWKIDEVETEDKESSARKSNESAPKEEWSRSSKDYYVHEVLRTKDVPRSCGWDASLDECRGRLGPLLEDTCHWILLGDLTMRRLARVKPNGKLNLTEARCGDYRFSFFDCPKEENSAEWVEPNTLKGEGPRKFGLTHQCCMDCGGCSSFHVLGSKPESSFRYLGVDYAKDVELPCRAFRTRTTQETVAHYLSLGNLSGSSCLVNAGLHDHALPGSREETYVWNVKEYLLLLNPFCHTIIWLTTSAVLDDPMFSQRNAILKKSNAAVAKMLEREMPWVFVMDVWEKTSVSEHADNVHLTDAYYSELAHFFLKEMTDFIPIY